MCKDKTALLLLEAMMMSDDAAAVKGKGKGKGKARSGRAGVAAGRQKLSPWTGVRFRRWGKWASEIRVPLTREKVWIGTFTSPRQAALAYDAAVFCFFGERPPKARKVNFPAAPRPEISETARSQLSVAEVKVIAEKHARDVDALLPPLNDGSDTTAEPEIPDLVVPAPTPVAVAAHSDGAGGHAAPFGSPYDDDELYEMVRAFDLEACNAELDTLTFIVPDDEYTELYAA